MAEKENEEVVTAGAPGTGQEATGAETAHAAGRTDGGRFVVIVLDGFGAGQMADVPEVRPADLGANTCVHIFENTPGLELPTLASLGLANAAGKEFPGLPFFPTATWGTARLIHQGADTFYGHQEIMGTAQAPHRAHPGCD